MFKALHYLVKREATFLSYVLKSREDVNGKCHGPVHGTFVGVKTKWIRIQIRIRIQISDGYRYKYRYRYILLDTYKNNIKIIKK